MKKSMLWILAVLLAAVFLYVIKNYDEATKSVDLSPVTNTISTVKKSANDTIDKAEEKMDDMVDGAEELGEDIAEGVEELGDEVNEGVDNAEEKIDDMIDGEEEVDTNTEVMIDNGYVEFDEAEMKQAVAAGKDVALFFHANWCPSCVALDEDIIENEDGIDENTVIYKVDYDTETDLAAQYNVSSQHTVVYLDSDLSATSVENGITSLDDLVEQFN